MVQKKNCEFSEKKLTDRIELYLMPKTNVKDNYEYGLKNVIIDKQKILLTSCHTVLILYDKQCLLKAELYTNKIPTDHLSELTVVLKKESIIDNENKLQNTFLARIKKFIFTFFIFILLKPISWLSLFTNIVSPVFKYSTLGLHLTAWFQNVKWTLTTILHSKKFTLKTTNYVVAMAIDVLLGHLFLKLLLHFLGSTSRSEILMNYAGVKILFCFFIILI